MTTRDKSSLIALFETGDVPSGQDYSDLIQSSVNVAEASAQNMIGPLTTTELITPRVSAAQINSTGEINAASVSATNVVITSNASIANVYANQTYTSSLTVYGTNTTVTQNITSTLSANTSYFSSDMYRAVSTIAASGTTLATANPLIGQITRLTSVSDGTNTGVVLQANKTGLIQYLYNETATSANLWPCTGGQINALASGAAYGLAANRLHIIVHTKASGYAVA